MSKYQSEGDAAFAQYETCMANMRAEMAMAHSWLEKAYEC